MEFSQAELALARQLKENNCYIWEPQFGDWVMYEVSNEMDRDIVLEAYEDAIYTYLYDENTWKPAELVWLPTVEQCIQIIKERDMEIEFDTGSIEVDAYYPRRRAENGKIYTEKSVAHVVGKDSLLEAFYSILLSI